VRNRALILLEFSVQRLRFSEARASQAACEHARIVRGWGGLGTDGPGPGAAGHELGVQPHIIEAVLNHVSGHKAGVAGIYNRARYEGEMRAALERWADHVDKITHIDD
jgi:hypothetical protein